VGLLFEAAAGLRRVFEHQLESDQSLSGPSFDVLVRLARTPGGQLRMSELAAQSALTPSGLTRSVDRLRRQGLVERRTCPEDRRGSFAVMTPAGRELMDRAVPEHAAHVDEILDELFTGGEEAMLSELLRRLRDHVRRDPSRGSTAGTAPPPGPGCRPDPLRLDEGSPPRRAGRSTATG